MPDLIISEIFGPTFQGEGRNMGQPVVFLRLGGCNLHCTWCDTPYTWRFSDKLPHNDSTVYDRYKELTAIPAEDVYEQVKAIGSDVAHLVVSGGEPLLQQETLAWVVHHLTRVDQWQVDIETAGTIKPLSIPFFGVTYNVSPKLGHSGNPLDLRYKPDVLNYFVWNTSASFKFVCTDIRDLDEVDSIVREVNIAPRDVYIMPEGVTVERITAGTATLADEVIKRGYNMTSRLHLFAFGDTRGT